MKIPFLSLKPSSDELNREINEAFVRVLQSGEFILGEEVRLFEEEWSRFCKTQSAVGVANGTEALTLALIASGVIQKDRVNEVITTPLSAGYTALAIVNAGAVPVFTDIDEKTFNFDPAQIEKAITPNTRAIIPVHLYGQTADMEAISKIAERYNLIIIEDAAQAHGADFNDQPCGFSSLAATFSFYPTKNLGAFGDGGAIVSNNPDFLNKVRLLRQGGHFDALLTNLAGRNSRLDEIQAAFLRVKLKKLEEWNLRRRQLAQIYFDRLQGLPGLQLPFVRKGSRHAFHLFVIRHPDRDKLKKFLFERGVETLIHYPYLLHQQNLFVSPTVKSLPVAEKIVAEILSLPLYPQLETDQINEVCRIIEEFEASSDSVFSHDANC